MAGQAERVAPREIGFALDEIRQLGGQVGVFHPRG